MIAYTYFLIPEEKKKDKLVPGTEKKSDTTPKTGEWSILNIIIFLCLISSRTELSFDSFVKFNS